MDSKVLDLLSYSVLFGAVIGLVRIERINRAYYPFILLLLLGYICESMSTVTIFLYKTNAIASNIYILIESLLLLLFFKNFRLFEHRMKQFWILGAFLLALWVVENFFIADITRFGSYFRIVYSLVIIFCSIQLINFLIFQENQKLIPSPLFFILVALIIYFSCNTVVEIFIYYGINASSIFRIDVFRIMVFVNFSANLTYGGCILWASMKRD